MLLRIVAAGTKLPSWVNEAVDDYCSRLRGADYRLELIEVALGQRSGGDALRAMVAEGKRMADAITDKTYVVALQVGGRSLSTEALAKFLEARSHEGRDIAFCIGGPEGLHPDVDSRADFRWSLSELTLPHGLARVVVAEALYRAVSVIKRLPYHRA